MIYSKNINRVCALCQKARKYSEEEMFCEVKGKAVPINRTACKKFSYDILKRNVKRMRRLKTDFSKEDFIL